MSMKHLGTKILAGVLVVLLAGAGVLIWRNLPEDAPRLQEPEETVRQEPEVQPDTTATLCVAGDIVAHMPLVADAWNGEAYDFTHLFADARRYYEAADYTTACLETTFNGPPYSGYPQFCAPDALAYGLKTVGFHLLSTASNHSMDTGYSGLVRTLDVLDAAGLEHVGTYRTQQERDTVKIIDVGGIKVGGSEKIAVIGGPCSIESEEQAVRIAREVKDAGGCMLRGGAYKPRTSPYAFQGLGTEGILAMAAARKATGMPIVSELMSEDKIDEFEEYVDLVQIGARNMQNFQLLKAVGKMKKPVLLKRGLANTIEEWIMSAEYIMAGGNENVIFCERGIRTFEKYTRNTLDLSVVPILKQKSHLPVIIDPSHATGDWRLVESMSLAAIAAGADGLIIEAHNDPKHALCDGAQSLDLDQFDHVMSDIKRRAEFEGRIMMP